MLTRRLVVCIIAGTLLGVICIIGAQIRSGFEKETVFLFAFWYNRFIMGMAIGLAGRTANLLRAVGRGAIIGFLVSFAFFISTGLNDVVGLLIGILYGAIIEYAGFKLDNKKLGVSHGKINPNY